MVKVISGRVAWQLATCNLQLATAITRRFKVCKAPRGKKEFLAAYSRKTYITSISRCRWKTRFPLTPIAQSVFASVLVSDYLVVGWVWLTGMPPIGNIFI